MRAIGPLLLALLLAPLAGTALAAISQQDSGFLDGSLDPAASLTLFDAPWNGTARRSFGQYARVAAVLSVEGGAPGTTTTIQSLVLCARLGGRPIEAYDPARPAATGCSDDSDPSDMVRAVVFNASAGSNAPSRFASRPLADCSAPGPLGAPAVCSDRLRGAAAAGVFFVFDPILPPSVSTPLYVDVRYTVSDPSAGVRGAAAIRAAVHAVAPSDSLLHSTCAPGAVYDEGALCCCRIASGAPLPPAASAAEIEGPGEVYVGDSCAGPNPVAYADGSCVSYSREPFSGAVAAYSIASAGAPPSLLWYVSRDGEATPGASSSSLFVALYAGIAIVSLTIGAGALWYVEKRGGVPPPSPPAPSSFVERKRF